jgi:iron complex outermembrane receptor protein
LNDNTLVYASITKGDQSGGFSGLSSNGIYAPETIISYELGAKGKLPSVGFMYSAALFHYDLKNLQSLQLIGIGGDGFPKYVTQTSNRKANGLDLDLQWQVNKFLKLYSTHEYIDLKYTNFTSPLGANLDGQVVGIPKFTHAAGLDLTWLAFGGRFNALFQGAYTSRVLCNSETIAQTACLKTPIFEVGTPRTRVDMRLQWESQKQFGIAMTVSNLYNKQYVTLVENTVTRPFDVAYGERTSPRKFNIEFSRKF